MRQTKSKNELRLVLPAAFRADDAIPVIAEITLSEAFIARIRLFNDTLCRLKAWSMSDAVKRMEIRWRYEEVVGRDSSLSILTVTQNAFLIESDYTRGPRTSSMSLSAFEALVAGKKPPRGVVRQEDQTVFYAQNRETLRSLIANYRKIQAISTRRR